jgi:hypothetical protein
MSKLQDVVVVSDTPSPRQKKSKLDSDLQQKENADENSMTNTRQSTVKTFTYHVLFETIRFNFTFRPITNMTPPPLTHIFRSYSIMFTPHSDSFRLQWNARDRKFRDRDQPAHWDIGLFEGNAWHDHADGVVFLQPACQRYTAAFDSAAYSAYENSGAASI